MANTQQTNKSPAKGISTDHNVFESNQDFFVRDRKEKTGVYGWLYHVIFDSGADGGLGSSYRESSSVCSATVRGLTVISRCV